MRRFVRMGLGQEGVPDGMTVSKFRHLLESMVWPIDCSRR